MGEPITATLAELAAAVGGEVVGDSERRLHGVATLDAATRDELSFLTNVRYRDAARDSRAGAVLVGRGTVLDGRDLLVCDEPYLALARILERFHPTPEPSRRVSERAAVDPAAELGEAVTVGAFAVIEAGARLGDRCVIEPHAVVSRGSSVGADSVLHAGVVLYPGTRVGERCRIHAGVVLGGDGFGFATSGGVHHKVPQVGRVVVEDDVEIGANSTVDRGALDDSVVGAGSKLDNLVMIGHGVRVGRGALLAGQAGVAGSTRLGDGTVMAGQSGVTGHVELAAGTIVTAKSAVFADVKRAGMVSGVPAGDHKIWKRSQAIVRRLPQMRERLRRLEGEVAALRSRLDEEEPR